jgi:hypothetical protein
VIGGQINGVIVRRDQPIETMEFSRIYIHDEDVEDDIQDRETLLGIGIG